MGRVISSVVAVMHMTQRYLVQKAIFCYSSLSFLFLLHVHVCQILHASHFVCRQPFLMLMLLLHIGGINGKMMIIMSAAVAVAVVVFCVCACELRWIATEWMKTNAHHTEKVREISFIWIIRDAARCHGNFCRNCADPCRHGVSKHRNHPALSQSWQ